MYIRSISIGFDYKKKTLCYMFYLYTNFKFKQNPLCKGAISLMPKELKTL